MIRKMTVSGLVLVVMGAMVLAASAQIQGRGQMIRQHDPASVETVVLDGVVESFDAAARGPASLVLVQNDGTKLTVILGPYRALQGQPELKTGQHVSVKAFKSHVAQAYMALEITDLASNTTIRLRDEAGMPRMGRGPFMGHGRGMNARGNRMAGGECRIDPAAKTTLDGTVDSVDMAAGAGHPGFKLRQSDNTVVTIVASPYWASADFKLSPGDKVSVMGFPCSEQAATYLAATIRNLTTNTFLTLRDDNGVPVDKDGKPIDCPGCFGMIHRP